MNDFDDWIVAAFGHGEQHERSDNPEDAKRSEHNVNDAEDSEDSRSLHSSQMSNDLFGVAMLSP
jgi:hypothetical protein